ncbi:MAG: hypothetical protein Q7T13_01650 [Polaromonas sp.]|nr:hypothetical protein [Polaromonas sp.]
MAKLNKFITSFEFGEISPRLLARVDLPAYNKATKTQENYYTLIHGGATKRRGTLYVGGVADETEAARLIPFVFSVDQKFMLVLNGGLIQFLSEGEFIESSPGVRYQLAIPYSESEIAEVQYAQSGNTMYLVHPRHHPKVLQRITDTNWTLTNIPFIYSAVSDVTFSNAFITFKIINGSTVFPVASSFTITTVAGAITGTSSISGAGNGQVAGVASMPGSTTTETWTVTCTLSSAGRQEWSVTGSVSGAASAYWKANNYPQSVSFFEQRLYFGGSPQFPQHIWGSVAGDYFNFTVGNRDSDGVALQIAGNDYNSITHMVSARSLMPLTSSTEFSLSGPGANAISGISSNVIKDHTRHGSNVVKPLRIGREIVFLQRDGKKARAISYSVTEDANVAPDITIFAEHMTRSATMVDMAFAADPDYIAWIVRSDGQLLSLTLAREFETTAWARHTTNGLFENVATVPGESADDVYLVVQRTIDGVEHRYVELFDYSEVDVCYSDSAVYFVGAPSTSITGLDHLEGETVSVVADGVVHPELTVTAGAITLQSPASTVIVGLPYTSTLELLNPEFGDASSSSQSRAMGVTDIVVRFQDTLNCKVNGVVIPFRTNTLGLDAEIPAFTGDKRVKSLGWRSPNNIVITSDTPTPSTILGVMIEAAVN